MPKLVRPSDQPPQLDDYISVFGNRARMTIIKYLQQNGPSLRLHIAEGTDMANPTLGHHLVELERIGVISGDLPMEERRGRTVRYNVEVKKIAELMQAAQHYLFA